MTQPELPDPPPSSGLTREDVLRALEAWRRAASRVWHTLLDGPSDRQ